MPKAAPTNWDNEAHLALLQALVLKAPPSAAQWDDVLEEVGKKGYIYTSSAAVYLPFSFVVLPQSCPSLSHPPVFPSLPFILPLPLIELPLSHSFPSISPHFPIFPFSNLTPPSLSSPQ